jgi:hypothetical protein
MKRGRWGGVGLVLLASLLVSFASCRRSQPVVAPRGKADPALEGLPESFFQDVTEGSGIGFTCRNGEEANHLTLLESLGGGVALIDYDGDGLLDVFLTGGGTFTGPDNRLIIGYPCKLYRNLGGWKFQDVTAQIGLDKIGFYNHGCAVADFDRDGWPDLLVTGYGGLALYHNESNGRGGRTFVEVTQKAGLRDTQWNTSAGWADLDGDGYPDLYVCRYVDWSWGTHRVCRGDNPSIPREVCPPRNFRGTPHVLYRNNRDGTFTDVSKEAGLRPGPDDAGMGLGVLLVDVNDDRKPDVYAVNDTTRNFLYVNRSSPGKLRFEEMAVAGGVALGNHAKPDGCMGVDAADYDGSGRPSLWVTTFEHERHALYRNECQPDQVLFRYVTGQAGIAELGPSYVGFGTGFIDIDGDGWEDLVIVNGHVRRFPTRCPLRQRPVLLRNPGTGRFANVTARGGAYFQEDHRGRGLAIGDLDNDGRPDLVVSHLNEPVVLLRNQPEGATAPKNHWLGIELVGRDHRDVAGARVVAEVDRRKLTRFTKGGGSYLSSGDRRLLFGLGQADHVKRVSVYWPWGKEQHWEGLKCDRYWRLIEGEPAARPPRRREQGGKEGVGKR